MSSRSGARALYNQLGTVTASPFPAAVGGLAATPALDGALLTWTRPTVADTLVVIETAPNNSGVPGAWTQTEVTAGPNFLLPLEGGASKFVRVRALLYGRMSELPADELIAAPAATVGGVTGAIAAAAASLAQITDDSIISADEKPALIREYQSLVAERDGLMLLADAAAPEDPEDVTDTQAAVAASASTYNNAMNSLINYMANLTTPVLWNDTSDFTSIVPTSMLPLTLVGVSSLHSAITFARSTTGTVFDSAGVMQTAAINAPRFDYDPATLTYLGLLVEPQRTNLFPYSATLSGGSDGTASVTADTHGAPDGSNDADTVFRINHSEFNWYVYDFYSLTAGHHALSAHYIGTDADYVGFQTSSGDPLKVSYAPATDTLYPGSATLYAQRRILRDGWIRVCVTGDLPAGSNVIVQALGSKADGAGGEYFTWGKQLEAGDIATSYIPTSGTTVTRSADVATFPASAIDATVGTFVMEHDCPAGDPLLGDGATAILVSQGPGKIALAYDATGIGTVYNGGAETTAAAITLGATLRILATSSASAIGHCKSLTWYPDRKSEAWMQGETA